MEVIKAYRVTKEKLSKNPVVAAWFLILLFAGVRMTLFVIDTLAEVEELLIQPSRGDVLFTLFFVLMAKASTETSEDTFSNQTLQYYFTSPIKNLNILLSRLFKVFWYNLLLVGVVMSIITMIISIEDITLPTDRLFYPQLYSLIILAPIAGFNIALFSKQENLYVKVLLTLAFGQILTIVWLILQSSLNPTTQLIYTSIMIPITIMITLISTPLFKSAWVAGINGKNSRILRFHRKKDFLPGFIPTPVRKVAQAEILRRWRNRQIPATIGVTALLSLGLLIIYHQLGPNPDIGFDVGKYFYPALIAMTAYTAVVIQSVIPSLTLFSRDGKRLWALRTTPVDFKGIVWGKGGSLLLFSPLTSAIVILPITFVLDYPIMFTLFALTAIFTMYFLFTGIGVWMGVMFPNFDETSRGAPDVIIMYTCLMLCLLGGALFLGLPTVILEIDRFLGLMACILFADGAALTMVLLFQHAGKKYEAMEI